MNHRMKRFILLRILVCLCVLALTQYQPPIVRAAELVVDIADDENDGGGCVVGDCSLREAIAAAGDGDTITFAGDYSIILTLGQLAINQNVTIDGTGHGVVVNGNSTSRVFEVGSGYTVSLIHLTITNGHVTGSDDGGGLRNSGGTVTLGGCVVQYNQARYGAGISNLSGGSLTVLNTTIVGNGAEYGGGGILNNGTLTMTASTLVDNVVYYDNDIIFLGTGGGLQNNAGTSTAVNSTFTGNQANGTDDDGGGAIMVYDGTVDLTNCTVAGNSTASMAGGGGGIRNTSGTVNLQNTLIADNTSSGSGPDIYGAVNSLDYNLIEDTADATIGGTTTHDLTGVDPLLAALGPYGGDTETMPLLPGSPAIDAADGTVCGAAPVDGVDQRGVDRTIGTSCDIGAYESRGFGVTITGGNNQVALINTAFASPLSVQATSAFGEPVGPNAPLTFAGPETGASTVPVSQTVGTAGAGTAQASVSANGTTGSYSVTVSAAGVITPAEFSLTNRTNQPPTAGGGTASAMEDANYVFTQGDLDYLDADSDPFVRLRIVALSGSGTLYLDGNGNGQADTGEAVSAGALVYAADFTAGRLKFKPLPNASGSSYASFTFRVYDGWAESTSDSTITVDVASVNDPPTLSPTADQEVGEGDVLGPLTVTVGDIDTVLTTLTLSAASSNPALVPVSGITFGGTGVTRTMTITPTPDMAGTATITVTVSDGMAGASDSFVLTVVEDEYVVYLPLVVKNMSSAGGAAVVSVPDQARDVRR